MKVSDILKLKGPEVFTIGEEKTLKEAVDILVNNNIGVLLALNSDAKMSGIISERDVVREIKFSPEEWVLKKVNDTMTKKVIVCEFEDDVDYVENVMTNNKIRHLPVLNKKVLAGLISIGDIVKAQLGKTRSENKYLIDYISGNMK